MSDRYAKAVELATEALNAGRFEDALNEALGVLALEPNHPDAVLLQAIALSQLGRAQEASDAFVRAVSLAPSSAKARYNAAVHEFNRGNRDVSLQLVNDALTIEPNHPSAKDLRGRIAVDVSYPGLQARSTPPMTTTGIPFIEKLGSVWTGMGWVLSVSIFICSVGPLLLVFRSPSFRAFMSNGNPAAKSLVEFFDFTAKIAVEIPAIGVMNVLGNLLTLGVIVFLILDLNHRRGNYLWLLPTIFCGCMGFSWLVLPLYLLLGIPKATDSSI